ncbi:MAG TPA: hypothetical protein VLE27_12120, partial [Thermoanaerobaculia bacterium]|nr:hypothetical protein [Thermoanaerobaculia bacterium]
MKKSAVFLLLLTLAALAPGAMSAVVDPFYQSLLRDGQHAFDRKDYAAAVRDLRLACFGMLDDTGPLADCLARLALAQDRLDDAEGFRNTFQRLVEIEDRFKAYSQGEMVPELRTALEARVAVRIPAATLEGIPAFRSLAARKPETAPAAAVKAPAAQKKPPVAVAAPVAAPGVATAPSEAERKALIRARLILSEQRPGKDELEEAFRISREVAGAHADLKEAHHLAAEAAYRLRRWREALQYFRSGGDPGEGQPDRL